MHRNYQIFVPEWVPLENKGEEAIIRGMADVVFPQGNAEFHILDMHASQPYHSDGLNVYPGQWFYSRWRTQEFRPGLRGRELYASACSLVRHTLNRAVPHWVCRPQRPLVRTGRLLENVRCGAEAMKGVRGEALKRLLACDYLIAGHDGAFNEYDCHVMNLLRRLGMQHGIFGSCMKIKTTSPAILALFRDTLSDCRFIYCRNGRAHAWAQERFPGLDIQLAPDPAFGMRPAPPERAAEIIAREGLEEFFRRPVVMMTPAEPAPVARHCFRAAGSRSVRLRRHHEVWAALVEHIVENCEANVLFLPHAIGPTPDLDDRRVARHVLAHLPFHPDRVRILETEYSARDLKALLARGEFLVAERVHSAIGAVGVATPFLCLGVEEDVRVRSIIGEMCRAENNVHLLNETDEPRLLAHFNVVWKRREMVRQELRTVAAELQVRLGEVGRTIRTIIEEATGVR